MAPTSIAGPLAKRQTFCDDGLGNISQCNSTWDTWGRWTALAVIVVVVLLLAFLFSCINSRRRRRRGLAPMYGTGWFPGSVKYGNNAGYYGNQPYNGGAAPPYSAPIVNPQTENTFNGNGGYYEHDRYGGQQSGIELQQPQNAYTRGGDPVYNSPQGPPPGKGDGFIR